MKFFSIFISQFLTHVPSKSVSKTPNKLWSIEEALSSSLPCLRLLGGSETVQPAILET